MIAKKDLKGGFYYKGICRATYVAYWDIKQGCFVHIDWNFGVPYAQLINHIEDVTGSTDGFIPVEAIEHLDRITYQTEREIAGY